MRIVVVMAILAVAGPASAQCAEGREVSESTAGRCCWPTQSWDATAARCSGPPACPPGRAAMGDDCVLSTAPVGPSPAPQEIEAVAPQSSIGFATPAPAMTGDGFQPTTPFDEGLVLAGGLTLGITWVGTGVFGIVASVAYGSWLGTLAWAPILGNLAWASVELGYGYASWGVIVGLPSAALEIAGLIILCVGLAQRHGPPSPVTVRSGAFSIAF